MRALKSARYSVFFDTAQILGEMPVLFRHRVHAHKKDIISLYWKTEVLLHSPNIESIMSDKRFSNCFLIENMQQK